MRLTAFTDFGLHALMRLARGRLRADPALPPQGPSGRIAQGDGMRVDR